jgi:ribulose-phosphate 3-epimerase
MTEVKIAPSLLAADPLRLFDEVNAMKDLGVDYLHLDIMDGNFVPNLSFGLPVAQKLKEVGIPLDIHLMVDCLDWAIPAFAPYAEILTIHSEASPHIHRLLQSIKELGCTAGLALNPGTSITSLPYLLDVLDLVLVMSVNPGWGGQRFLESSLKKVNEIRELINKHDSKAVIEVDGGVTSDNAESLIQAGADILVSGSYIFRAKDKSKAIHNLKKVNIRPL